MTTEQRSDRLVAKLQAQADLEEEKRYKLERQQIVERNVRKLPTVTEACRKNAKALRAETEAIWDEINQRKLLQLAREQHTRANVVLLAANKTPGRA
jgi:hypothetical protein